MVRLIAVIWLTALAFVEANTANKWLTNQWLPNINQFPTDDLNGEHFMDISKHRSLPVEFFDLYSNLTLSDLYGEDHISRVSSTQDVECLRDLSILAKDLASFKMWALKMIDSWGTLPSGMLAGNLWDLGNYDECLGIDHEVTTNQSIRGKYCLTKISPSSSLPSFLSIKMAVCFPASCFASHMDTLLKRLLQKLLKVELSSEVEIVNEKSCQIARMGPVDGLTTFTIVLLSMVAVVVGTSTIYDFFYCGDEKNLHVVVKAISARANSRAIFRIVSPKSNPNVIDCLHGIRSLSFIWVVFSHDYGVHGTSPNINLVDMVKWLSSLFSMVVKQGVFAVDSFFFLSGLLLVVIALRTMERNKGKLNIPLMYLGRYLRLTPLLIFAILMYLKILPILGNGPIFTSSVGEYSSCEYTWFWTLLFVQNYATSDLCLVHTWYLAVDMQLFIFAPFLLIALYKWGKKAAAGIFVLMLLLACCLFSMMVIGKISLSSQDTATQRKLYYTTNTRASPYLIGILFGYFLHLNRGRKFKLPRIVVLLGWLVGLSLIGACVFSVYKNEKMPLVEEAFYLTLTRIAWPLGLCWVVFACIHGYGYLADSLLSCPLWQPISRLSYAAYIFHMFILSLNGGIIRTSTYFSNYQVILRFWSDIGLTMFLAYLTHILIEAPFCNMVGLLLPSKKPHPKPQIPAKESDTPPSTTAENKSY